MVLVRCSCILGTERSTTRSIFDPPYSPLSSSVHTLSFLNLFGSHLTLLFLCEIFWVAEVDWSSVIRFGMYLLACAEFKMLHSFLDSELFQRYNCECKILRNAVIMLDTLLTLATRN